MAVQPMDLAKEAEVWDVTEEEGKEPQRRLIAKATTSMATVFPE